MYELTAPSKGETMMKKRVIICAGIIAMTLSVPVFADDITVRTKDGEMTFTEGEAVDVTTGELTNKIKEALSGSVNALIDFSGAGTVNLDLGESQMNVGGNIEGTISSFENTAHAYISYNTDLMGQQNKGIYETYCGQMVTNHILQQEPWMNGIYLKQLVSVRHLVK
jgi:hypothetical protein